MLIPNGKCSLRVLPSCCIYLAWTEPRVAFSEQIQHTWEHSTQSVPGDSHTSSSREAAWQESMSKYQGSVTKVEFGDLLPTQGARECRERDRAITPKGLGYWAGYQEEALTSFNKYFVNNHYVSGIVLKAGETAMTKLNIVPTLMELII